MRCRRREGGNRGEEREAKDRRGVDKLGRANEAGAGQVWRKIRLKKSTETEEGNKVQAAKTPENTIKTDRHDTLIEDGYGFISWC